MTYAELLPKLRARTHILVTGPQRSGTTIAAECIAADLGRVCVKEEAFGVGGTPGGSVADWWRLILAAEPAVVQCPSMSVFAHYVPEPWVVVWMVRPLEEIFASEERINWDGEQVETDRYFHMDGGSSAQVKRFNWNEFQVKSLGDRAFELDYHSLSSHRLWVPKEQRVNFGPRQTSE